MSKSRGLFEKIPGSGVWWIRYADAGGRIRREKAGTRSAALALYRRRKTEVLQGRKLPETLRSRPITFSEIADAALSYSRAEKASYNDDCCRMERTVARFGSCTAESIRPEEFERWLNDEAGEREWTVATKNRYIALIKLTYRLAERNGKISTNPARLLRMRKENNARVRYLGQYAPDEEARLRSAISSEFPEHLPEFEIALHTGMRRSEQYRMRWRDVDFGTRVLTVPQSKHGEKRHIGLNSAAMSVLGFLRSSAGEHSEVFLSMRTSQPLQSNKHWFEDAVKKAGIRDFHWHDLRHTFGSRLAMAGVDLRTIQELMGHKTIQMTCRYAHLSPQHQLAAVEKLVDVKPDLPARTDTITSTARFDRVETEAARLQ